MIRRPPRSTLFPTRRSSDLIGKWGNWGMGNLGHGGMGELGGVIGDVFPDFGPLTAFLDQGVDPSPDALESVEDRKSTRLNSSHANISYAVFCLKKKKKYKLDEIIKPNSMNIIMSLTTVHTRSR